jgi:hypothetical protein
MYVRIFREQLTISLRWIETALLAKKLKAFSQLLLLVTFKDLQKVIESQPGQGLGQNQLQRLRGLPFWYWDKTRHKEKDRITKGECCWNHCVDLPKKDGIEKPLFDYQKLLYKALLEPGFLNSNPKLHSSDPDNVLYPFKEKHI